jgi:hypothetical protein
MKSVESIVQGTLNPDGTLELDEKPKLAPGRVLVILRPTEGREGRRNIVEVLQEIWRRQQARGFKGYTAEELESDIRELRDETAYEERWRELESLGRTPPPPEETG